MLKFIIVVLGILLGAYVGIYEGLAQGVIHVIEGAVAVPIDSWSIAEGVVRFPVGSSIACAFVACGMVS